MKNSIKKLFSEILAVLLIVQPISPVFAQGIAEETTQKIVFYENSAEEQSEESAEIKDSVLREQDKQAVSEENKEEEAKENPATENQEEQPAFEQSVNVDGMQITVKADEGVFADADKVSARKVTGKEEEKVNEAIEQEHSDNDRMTKSYTFDIKVLDSKGNELQPNNEKGGVYVSFLPVNTEQEALNKGNIEVSVYHTNSEEMDTLQNEDSLQVTKLNVDVNTETANGTTVVTAKTDGFSYYTVEFTYGEKQYVLNGDSSTKLTEILKHVGISLKSGNESITKAESSEPELFSVSKNTDGEWTVSALKAFSVTEKLTVEADGISYEIAVTDSQHPLTVTGGTEGVDYEWRNYAYFMNGSTLAVETIGKKYILHILTSKAMVIEGDATQFTEVGGMLAGQGGAIVIPEGVKANLTLKNTKIIPKKYIPPMTVMKNAECKLTLEGENTLTPRLIHSTVGQGEFDKVPAIWVPEGAKLTVSEASTGVLTAESAYQNAVTGGWRDGHAGTIIIDGGTLKLNNDGDTNSRTNISGPCIGGYKKLDGIIINGGKIEATCAQSAPIGMSFGIVENLGTIIVNGGTIVTRHQNYFGPISYYADGIGDVQHYTNVTVKINGGNVDTDFDRTRPKNDSADVYRVKITLSGAGEGQEITSYTLLDGTTINLNDAKTLPNGELYLWLPVNTVVTGVHCNGQDYTGVVKAVNNDNDAQAVFKIGTTGTLTASLKAEHVQGVKLSRTTGLSAGDTVYLSFSGVDGGYLFKGMCLYTGTTLPSAPLQVGAEFTKITDKLYSFKMPAENVTVYLNAPKIRTVSAEEQTHITSVSFNPTANLTVGDTVKLAYATEAGWKVTGMALRKATDPATNPQDISSDFTKLSDGSYQFTMPDYDVCVDFKCEEKAASGAEASDFIISDANCNYSFDTTSRTLTLSGDGRATISMKSGASSTSDCIKIAAGASINLTIKNLTVSAPQQGVSGLTFPDDIGDCKLILEGTNQFTSNQANTPAVFIEGAKLTISGKGKLIASAERACGIGSPVGCKNLYIEGGTIRAEVVKVQKLAIGHGAVYGNSSSTAHYMGGTVEGIYKGYGIFCAGLTGENANVIITGGSIHSVNKINLSGPMDISRHTHPTNGSTRVYLTTITLGEGATLAAQAYVTALTGAGTYGINQMHTDDEGKLYLWLPENTTVTKVETDKGIYQGSVTTNTNGLGTANAVFTLAEKQEGSGSVAIENWTYGESAKTPVPTSTTNGTANVSYTYFTDEACTTKTTRDNSGADSIGSVPKNVGSYWVQATFAETPRYKAFTAKAGFAISKATVSFTPPTPKTGLAYTGETQELINAGTVDTGIGKLAYSLSEAGTYSETIPRAQDAGTYRVYYKVVGTNANYDYTNAKGDIEVSIGKIAVPFTPPTAKTGLAYTGEAQALINVGTVDTGIGKLTYSLSETGTYTETLPKAQDAGTYSVYYKVVGTNANYDYTNAKGNIEVSIAKVSITPTVALADWHYGTSPNTPTVTGNTGNGVVTYEYFTDESCTIKTTTENNGAESEGGVPKNAGGYWIQATIAETANYSAAAAKAGFEIKKANQTALSISNVTGKKYGDADFTLTTTGGSGYGAVSYGVPANNGVLEIIGDTAKIIGVGSVKVMAVKASDNNYNETSAELTVTIGKGDAPAITFPTAGELTYGQKLSESTLTGGSTEHGTFAWKDGDIIPTIENTGYDVVFTPNATALKNYNIEPITRNISVKVNKQPQANLEISEITPKTYGDKEFKLKTTGGTGNGAVSYSVPANNGVLEINEDTAKIVGSGTVTVTAKKAEDDTHKEAIKSVTVTIAKKNLTVKAENKTIRKGSAMPIFTYMVNGLVNGDIFVNPILTPSVMNTDTVGEYDITISGGTLKKSGGVDAENNYAITYQKGKLTIANEIYEVKVVDGTGGGIYSAGQTVTIKADEKSGYTFIGWSSDDGVVFANASAKETSFVMPARNITVTADYSANSSGGSSGGGSSGGSGGSNAFKDDGSIIIKTEKAPDFPTTAEIIVKAKKGDDKTATAEISEKTVENAIKKAQEEAKKKGKESNGIALEINIAMPKGTDKVKMNLSENALGKMVSGEVKHLTVNGSFVKVAFDKKAVFEIKKQSEGDVSVHVIPIKKLSKEAEKLIGNRSVYDISLSNGNGKKITDFGNGTATVFLSYKPEKKETIGGLYAVYVDKEEKAFRIDPSAYDVNSGSVIFATNHLSIYGVGYTAPSERFDDTKNHWAKDFIDYVVGRGLLDGSTENKFYPNEKMTRGMLVTALGKLAGVNVKQYETNSFTDVQNDNSYRPYIDWAHSKGVIYGIGNDKFAPDKSITREEMAVIFERYAKVTGCKIPVTREASSYEDKENIGTEYRAAVKAMQQAGIMMGIDGNKFNPKENATRAEVSAMLSRYIKLTITPETAQGFVLDDAGKYHYYKDGKALTGKQILDGTVYFFNESGVLQTGWVKDGNIWRYYDGTKAHKGWLNLKVEGEERIYYLNREGLLESGKWVKIDGKWYYFYPDGTLAVNTEIDGYKVDGKGVRKEK